MLSIIAWHAAARESFRIIFCLLVESQCKQTLKLLKGFFNPYRAQKPNTKLFNVCSILCVYTRRYNTEFFARI